MTHGWARYILVLVLLFINEVNSRKVTCCRFKAKAQHIQHSTAQHSGIIPALWQNIQSLIGIDKKGEKGGANRKSTLYSLRLVWSIVFFWRNCITSYHCLLISSCVNHVTCTGVQWFTVKLLIYIHPRSLSWATWDLITRMRDKAFFHVAAPNVPHLPVAIFST